MSNRPPNERVQNVGAADGASPYKRPRAQSPGAVQGSVPPAPQQPRPGAYPYPQDTAARYAGMPVPTSYPVYRESYQTERADFRRDMEMPTRRRPTLLPTFSSHAAALERERHAQEQQFQHFGYTAAAAAAERDVVAASQYMNRGGPVPQAAPAPPPPPPPHQQVPPKRPKLALEPRPELTQPLRIDTDIKREPVYNPQVEAISPTLPGDDSKSELSSVQSSKEELLQSINRVDREIGKVEMQISKLTKKQSQFLAEQNKPPEAKSAVADIISEPKHQSIAQIIYAENRKKAESAHSVMSKLGQKVDLPLYNQPSDTAVYHENKRSYMTFKKRLLLHFKKKHHSRVIRERYLTERYDQLMQAWLKRLERSENNAKRRAKDVRTREFFEKVFPELKKQREDRERIQSRAEANSAHHSRVGANNRVGGYARSEAELEQIMDGLHEQEEEEKKMRSYAVIPPMLLDARQRQLRFSNNNGLIEDPMPEYKDRQVFNVWTQAEKDLFKERFLQHPKNFGYIASFLERKSVQECVQYYYLSKKSENYKQLLRKQSVKKRKFPKHPRPMRPGVSEEKDEKPEVQESEPVPIIHNTPKVSFSVLRERKLPEDRGDRGLGPAAASAVSTASPASSSSSSSASMTTTTTTASTTTATTTSTTVAATTSGPATMTSTTSSQQLPPTPSSSSAASSAITSSSSSAAGLGDAGGDGESAMEVKTEVKAEVKTEPGEEGDVKPELGDQAGGTHQCAICKLELEHYARSRPLTKANCENYGIKEAELKHDMRVCSSCRCRSVRKRYTHCPVPMCKTPKRKVKRLRPLPSKWGELPNELKDPIIKELQLTDEITRCCSACFNRIARRLGNNPQTNEPLVPLVPENADEVVETPRWTEEEMEIAKQGLREHGRDWAAISASVATKSEAQCKNFYFNYKRKFGLEQLVEESKRNKAKDGSDGRTISTSESVTSTITAPSEEDLTSSDEDNGEDNDETSDTASAASPPPVHRSDQRHDSSTVDAMEVDEVKKDGDKSLVVEEKPPEGLAGTNPTLSASQGSLRSIPDYDSSATLSADEGPPSSSHTHGDTHGHEGMERKGADPGACTATSEAYVSSSGRTYANPPSSGAQSKLVLQGPGQGALPSPAGRQGLSLMDGMGKTNHRRTIEGMEREIKGPPGMIDKRASPACVRDLIDHAIERNIVQDLRTQKEQSMGDYHSVAHVQHMVPTNRDGPQPGHPMQPGAARMPFIPKEAVRKEGGHRDTPDLPGGPNRPLVVEGRHTDSPYPHHGYPTRDEREAEAQDLSRRTLPQQPVRDRSPHTAYKGNPRDYDPHDPRYHELYRRHQPDTSQLNALRAPPPAHSHHPVNKRHTGLHPSEGLHQLASAASEREPHRPHSSEPREKSPSGYMPDRSQMTPPALRQSVSPYGMDRQGQHARQPAQMGRNAIGQPPPLIKQTVSGKPPMKSEKMSPIGQPPPGGSITQGTPVQQQPSSQSQATRFEGSISMGTPRYDSSVRGPVAAQGGSISMGTPRYEPGAGRGTPPMHPEGAMAPRMPSMYDPASMNRAYDAMRMMHDRSVPDIYRRLSPTGQYYAAAGIPFQHQQQPGAQYPPELSSSRAVLMGDFLTAQQMQHQEAQRRADKERQLSPRSREPMGREALQGKNPYPGGVLEQGMPPPPFGAMYVHPGQVPQSQDRVSGRTSSPMPPRDATPPRSDGTPGLPPAWSQGHPGVRGPAPSQGSPGGGGGVSGPPMAPDDHRHPTPPPRQNVIRSITHGTPGSMVMDQRISPRPNPPVNTHLNGSSPFATLVNVAVNAPTLAVPPKDRHQLSPVGIRDHPNKERAHAIAMEQERERQEREKERYEREVQQHREAQPREVGLTEAQHREAQYREAHHREVQHHEAQQRGVAQQREREAQAREAQVREAREAQVREAQAREAQALREAQVREAQARSAQHRGVQQREVQRMREMERREQERIMIYKEMEARQAAAAANAERERHERESREREHHERMINDAHAREHSQPASREAYHHQRPPSSGGTLRPLDRPPDGRPYRDHMETGPPAGYSYQGYGAGHPAAQPQPHPPPHPPRPESGGMGHRPPSRDSKVLEAVQDRRPEIVNSLSKDMIAQGKPGQGGGGGSSGSSAGSTGPSSTFTAANLIDAIIIHQINNGSNSSEEERKGHGPPSSSAASSREQGGPLDPASKYLQSSTSSASLSSSSSSYINANSQTKHHLGPHGPLSQGHPHQYMTTQSSHHHPQHPQQQQQQQQQQQHPGGMPKPDATKDQRSPPFKHPKKALIRDYEPHDNTHPNQNTEPQHPQHQHPQHQQAQQQQQQQPQQQQTLQRELSSSSTGSHPGVSSSVDVDRSQGGSPASDKSVKSNHSAHSSSTARAMITLGEHIDQIIIQDYTRKGQGASPNNGQPSADTSIHAANKEGTSKTEDMTPAELSANNAIKSFLAAAPNSNNNNPPQQQQHHHPHHQQQQQQQQQHQQHQQQPDVPTQSPPVRPTSSPSSHGSGLPMAPDSSQQQQQPPTRGEALQGRPRSMSLGHHQPQQHKQQLPYRPPPMLGSSDHLMGHRSSSGPIDHQQQPMHNGPHRHPSPQPPSQQQGHGLPPPHSQPHGPPMGQSHRPTPSPGLEMGPNERPRSQSGSGMSTSGRTWNNWKVKRAFEQEARDKQMMASAHSPIVLAPDEREIVKVARKDNMHSPADARISQSGQPPDRRSPQVGYNMEPISPASSSTDSGGPESGMKTSPPRSPRIHQGMMGHAALTPSHPGQQATKQQLAAAAAAGAGQQPISSLAASHQAITSLLSRPQNKQTSYPADSSMMGQRGDQPPTGHRQHVNPLTYVQDKIAEVIKNPESSPRPSSSSSSSVATAASTESGNWDKRMLHPLDAGRYAPLPPQGAVESSTHRDWGRERYLGGRSPLRDDTVTGSKQRSPRPSIHSQSSEESQGSAVSSADDVYNATSSTAMKPPGSGGQQALAGRDYRERLANSPMMAEAYPRSPRPSYSGRMPVGMAESSSRSPQFSPVGTSDMVVSASCAEGVSSEVLSSSDHRTPHPNSSSQQQHPHSHSHHPPRGTPHSVQSPREGPADDSRNLVVVEDTANSNMVDSPHSDRMVIDEVGGADSSAQAIERISPTSEGSQTGSSISTSQQHQGSISTSSKPEYMDVDSQSGKLPRSGGSEAGRRTPSVGQSPHPSIESSSPGVVASSSAPPHVDSSRYTSPHYSSSTSSSSDLTSSGGGGRPAQPPPHAVHTSTEGGVSTSSAAASYGGRYLYPGLANQHPHSGPPLGPRTSPAPSTAPPAIVSREAEPSPLLQSQYDPLSDDE